MSDHAGFSLKEALKEHFSWWKDMGAFSKAACDYPVFAQKGAQWVQGSPARRGVFICGSGVGMSIVANRFAGIRAVLAANQDIALLSRAHNHSNVLCLGAHFFSPQQAYNLVCAWLLAPESTEQRHINRIRQCDHTQGG